MATHFFVLDLFLAERKRFGHGDSGMRHLDLFSGIGGFALAASHVWGDRHEIVCFCEQDKDCQKTLCQHWPGIPIHIDVKKFKQQSRISKHRGYDYGRIDLLTGGFPCQPYSTAGKRRGSKDDRALWPEMLRIVKETKPTWIIGENVAGFASMGLDVCLSDLESQGYEARPFVIPACSVQAVHRRDRIWIVANNEGGVNGCNYRKPINGQKPESGKSTGINTIAHSQKFRRHEKQAPESCEYQTSKIQTGGRGGFIANPTFARLEGWLKEASQENAHGKSKRQDSPSGRFQIPKPSICRGHDGLSTAIHRTMLGQLGNAIVPQVVMVIMAAIQEVGEV